MMTLMGTVITIGTEALYDLVSWENRRTVSDFARNFMYLKLHGSSHSVQKSHLNPMQLRRRVKQHFCTISIERSLETQKLTESFREVRGELGKAAVNRRVIVRTRRGDKEKKEIEEQKEQKVEVEP